MGRKQIVKITVDLCMTLLLLFLMGYQLWGEAAHEWAGAGIFLLFFLHQWLNRSWYQNLFRGKYSPMRCVMLVVNLLLLAVMFSLMFSAVVLSRYVFSFVPVHTMTSLARKLHMAGAYWSFVLMALHLGLHWNMILGMIARMQKKPDGVPGRRTEHIWTGAAACAAAYGIYVFVKRDLFTYLFLRTEFVFLDYGESKILFYVDYLAMMVLFVFVAHYGSRILRKRAKS